MIEALYREYDCYIAGRITQWDANQKIKIAGFNLGVVPTVLFSNRVSVTANPVVATVENGDIICDIPNGLLTMPYPITVYIRITKNGETTTVSKVKILVNPATRPDDYECIENIAIVTYEEIMSRIDNLVLNSGDSSAEVADARVGADNTVYTLLKNRLDGEYAAMEQKVDQLSNDIENKTTELKGDLSEYTNASETEHIRIIPTWKQKILLDDGTVEDTNVLERATTDLIHVPKGMSAVIGHGSQTSDMETDWAWRKTCIYDADKNFIDVIDGTTTNFIDGECYIRVYIVRSVDMADIFCSIQLFNKTVPIKNKIEIEDIKSNSTAYISGNLITITDGSNGLFEDVSFDGGVDSSLTVSGKNLFRLDPSRVKAIEKNVTMEFSASEGTIKIYTTEEGASADYIGPHIVSSLNGVTAYALYKIKFPVDTWITVSSNPSEFLHFESGVFMQVLDGKSSIYNDKGMGYTLLAKAGVEYGIRFYVASGWTNTEGVTFRPQIEIGTHKTEFESFHGCIVSGAENNDNNRFSVESDVVRRVGNFWLSYKTDGSVSVKTESAPTSDSVIYNESGLVNGISLKYSYCFTPEVDTNIYIGCEVEPGEYKDYIHIQATDGSKFYNDDGNGTLIPKWSAGTECAIRFIAKAGLECDWVKITPVVRTGASVARCFNGLTNIIVSDGTFSASYPTQSKFDKMELELGSYKNINLLTSGFISHPFEKFQTHKPMISFIDDDTTKVSLVKKYHDIFEEYGVVGNYAVMTARMTNADHRYDAEGELLSLLKEYEMEGFGMLYHCYWQHSTKDPTLYFKLEDRDISAVRKNLLTGLRDMQSLGFNNYRYWVTPYGVNDEGIQNIAKELGLKCLISMSNNSYISRGYADRWSIPRYSVSAISENSHLKAAMDACAEEKGWINIVTHVNSWADTPEVDVETKLKEIIEYALSNGYEIVAFPQAFERWKSVFMLQELF